MTRYISLLFLVLLLASCKEERRTIKPFDYQQASLLVSVTHKYKGSGEGFLVHAYENREDLKAQKPYASARTNAEGEALFSDLHVGLFFVDCTVPGDTIYYALDSVWATQDIRQKVELFLEPQP